MDLPLILTKLGYHKTKTDGMAFWGGSCATSFNTWEQMSGCWPSGNHPLSGKAVFESAWQEILLEQQNTEYKYLRQNKISGYAPISDQLDMLYWDVASGLFGEQAKQSNWFQDCSGVKADFPKPN